MSCRKDTTVSFYPPPYALIEKKTWPSCSHLFSTWNKDTFTDPSLPSVLFAPLCRSLAFSGPSRASTSSFSTDRPTPYLQPATMLSQKSVCPLMPSWMLSHVLRRATHILLFSQLLAVFCSHCSRRLNRNLSSTFILFSSIFFLLALSLGTLDYAVLETIS